MILNPSLNFLIRIVIRKIKIVSYPTTLRDSHREHNVCIVGYEATAAEKEESRRDPPPHPTTDTQLQTCTRPAGPDDETDEGTRVPPHVSAQLTRPESHRGSVDLDGEVDPGQ